MAVYETIHLDKSMYRAGAPFTSVLEALDPSAAYEGTDLAGLDAYQRQLKRFGIRVSGAHSDPVQKFFSTADSACLFPEYVARAVGQGMTDGALLDGILAAKTDINSLDYRSVVSDLSDEDKAMPTVEEGGQLPEVTIKLSDQLVKLVKRGRLLVASYEAIKFQRLDLITVTLRQIGGYIARAQLKDAVAVLLAGAAPITAATPGTLAYGDLLNLWAALGDYEMNTLVVSPATAQSLLALPEMRDSQAGLTFHGTGKMVTPLGAGIIKTPAVDDGTLIALDRRYALEMVTAGGVNVEYDKLIDSQLERAAVTSTAGFAKLFPDAVKVLKLSA